MHSKTCLKVPVDFSTDRSTARRVLMLFDFNSFMVTGRILRFCNYFIYVAFVLSCIVITSRGEDGTGTCVSMFCGLT